MAKHISIFGEMLANQRAELSEPSLEKRGNPLENPATPLGQGMDYLLYLLAGEPTAAGEPISEHSAMQISVVYACVDRIARDVGSIPLYVYERTATGHKRVDDTQLADVLGVEPHPYMTPGSFKTAVTANCVMTGNGYAEITWDNAGQPFSLTPRIATKVSPRVLNGELFYACTDVGNVERIVAASDMLHIPGLALDGILGMNPIRQMRQAMGLATAAEKAAARLFGNGVLSSGILTIPNGLSDTQKVQLKQSFEQSASGKNQMRPIVVPADAKFQPLTINPADAQFLETRKYSSEEICRVFGLPPHKVGILDRATNNNIEHQGIEYVTSTLRPYLVRWEEEIQRKLIPRIGRNAGKYFVRFDVSELLRGDQASTSAYYSAALDRGWMSPNEIRVREGMNPYGKAGDVYTRPLNMVNAEEFTQTAGAKPADDTTDATETQPDSTVGDSSAGQERVVLQYGRVYRRMFRDAMGRLLARDKRDLDAISKVFKPVLDTIAEHSISDVNSLMRTKLEPEAAQGLVTEYVRALEKRATKWTSTDAEELTDVELTKAVRTIVLGVYRDAGAAIGSAQLERII